MRVGNELLLARKAVVVATGTGPALPPIPGLAAAAVWTNREATTAAAVPGRLLVLGGGVVGVELAQAWVSLGSSVTLVELSERLLVREEPFAGEDVAAALVERGVEVRTGVRAVGAERVQGEVILELQTGERLAADELLVAVGRRPATDDESIGRQLGGRQRSLAPHPLGKYQAWVAAVGHTLESARAAELDVIAVDHPSGAVAGASFRGRRATGTSRIVVDAAREVVVGATFTGPDMAELLHAATVAVVGEVPIARLRHAVPAFPTRSEVWLRLLERYEEETSNAMETRRLNAVA